MKPNIPKSASIVFTSILFFLTPLCAQQRQNADNQEINYVKEGEQWTREAFNARMSESAAYPGWLNREGMLDQGEFNRQIFRRWDSNRDGTLDYQEYTAGNMRWAEEFGDNFEAFDLDGDGSLSAGEFGAGMEETGIYDTWDVGGEGYLTEEEFGESLFNTMDTNEDGYLGEDEFGTTEAGTWFNSDVDGGATGTFPEGGGATGTDVDSSTDIETGTESGTDTDIGTGSDIGTGTDTGTGSDSGGGIDY